MSVDRNEQYGEQMARLYPELFKSDNPDDRPIVRTVTFQVTDDCNLACFVAGTKILMADFSYKNIEDVKVGDMVMSFPEHTAKNKQLTIQPTKVTHTFIRHDKVRKITTTDGESVICTDEHPFLSGRRTWMRAESLCEGVHKLTKFWGFEEYKDADIYSDEYMKGYIIAVYLGDGCMGHYKNGILLDEYRNHSCRLAVKDTEIIERVCSYLDHFNINYDLRPFKISSKDNVVTNAIYFHGKENAEWLDNLIRDNFNKNINRNYLCGFLAGIIDTEGSVSKSAYVRIFNTNENILNQTETALNKLGIQYVYDKERESKNYIVKTLRTLNKRNTLTTLTLLKIIQPAVRKKSYYNFYDMSYFKRADIQSVEIMSDNIVPVYNLETEASTYIANNFAVHNCKYCYQINKGKRQMSLETAKKFVDMLLDSTPENNIYINPEKSPFLIMDFIGGEPLLEVDLIDQILDYFIEQAFERMHPWATRYFVSICSNGVLYFEPNVQRFLKKHRNHLSLSITIDGNKELHDSCRVFHDGRPSYDLAVAAAKDWMENYGSMGSKITIAPENITFLYDALVHMVDLNYDIINANCVFEEGWTPEHATELYNQMKRFADYLLDNNFYDKIYCSLYEDFFFEPMDEEDNDNWCWGAGTPILTTEGYKPIEDIKIGDMVYTENGNIRPVINTTSHIADNVVKISGEGIFDLVCTDNHKLFAKPQERSYGKYEVSTLKDGDLVRLFRLPKRNKTCSKYLPYILGYYMRNGYRIGDQFKICVKRKYKSDMQTALDRTRTEYIINGSGDIVQFIINKQKNNVVSDLLNQCGDDADKHLPPECLTWQTRYLEIFTDTFLEECVDYDDEIRRYYTTSYRLAQDLMLVFRTLGYAPKCKVHAEKKRVVRYEIYFHQITQYIKTIVLKDQKLYINDLTQTPVESQRVYNITVDEDHSYIAGGIASANCGGTGAMLACDPDGYLYPCIRYMESSLGDSQPPIRIGHVDTGLVKTEEEKQIVKCLDCITRRSQSTDECFYCPIAKGCAWCFPAGTKISTPDGLRNIEDIKTGDLVLDKDGNPQKVYNNLQREADDLVYVKAAGLMDLLTTKEHPFWCRPVISRNNNIPVYGEPRWVPAGELKTSDRIALFVPEFGDQDIDKEIAYILGYYIGDGWKTNSNRLKHPYRYYICTSFDKQKELEMHLNNANVTYTKSLNKTVAEYNIHISGTNNEKLTNLFDQCGRYAKDKHVPYEIWNWNVDSVKAFLDGYFDADGYFDKNKNCIRFTSISYELILNVSELVRAVYHKNVSIYKQKNNSTSVIDGRIINQSVSYEGQYSLNDNLQKTYYQFDEQNNIMWINVSSSKEILPSSETVYNLSVENNPTFIANGAIVHNCSGYNYQVFGTADQRATYICEMHKARSLANAYYWNNVYRKRNENKRFKIHCPEEWALPIIGKEEYNTLLQLERSSENEN